MITALHIMLREKSFTPLIHFLVPDTYLYSSVGDCCVDGIKTHQKPVGRPKLKRRSIVVKKVRMFSG